MAEENQGTVADAINEALGIEEPDDTEVDETEEEGDADGEDTEGDGGSDSDESDDDSDSETDEEESDDDAEGEEEPDPKGKKKESEFNEDGTRKDDKKKGAKPDPINDPIPKDLKKETSERMQSLIKIAKDVTAERDNYRGQFDTIINGIKATNTTPEQYGEVIQWMGLFNSSNVEDRKKAYELVESVADRLATLLGIDRSINDPLAQHADLKAEVTAGKLTAERAKEIARHRNQSAFKGQLENNVRTQQQTQEQQQQELAAARTSLTQLEQQLRKDDPLYDRKREILVPALRKTFKRIPPSQWADAFKEAYAEVKVKPKGKPAVAPKGQPLRAKQPAGGQTRQAGSALEAMNGALASMGK